MEIRRYRESDCAATISLFRRTVRRVNRRDYSQEQVEAWAPDHIDPAAWNGSLLSGFALVAEENGCLVGFGDMDDCGYLNRLFVSADCQREGIGSKLVRELEKYALEIGALKVTAEVSVSALPFFESMGYTVAEEQNKLHNGVYFLNFVVHKALN